MPVLWQAPIMESNTVFPVVVFTHGLGGNRTTYSTICSDIASHGYIVAVLEHRYLCHVVNILLICRQKPEQRGTVLIE